MIALIKTILVALCAALVGVFGGSWFAAQQSHDRPQALLDQVRTLAPAVAAATRAAPRVMRTIYLNGEGAVLRAGKDDAKRNVSSIVAAAEQQSVEIPAFDGAHARWKAIAQCVAQKFSAFDVVVTDQRPVEGDYVMAIFGGRAKALGSAPGIHAHGNALGLSPYNGKPIEDAVVLVFTDTTAEQLKLTCEAAGMEIAHAYGLDHARHCGDLMTYLPGCGLKRFVDKPLRCGEHADRDCGDGAPTQNSYMHLLELLGPRREP